MTTNPRKKQTPSSSAYYYVLYIVIYLLTDNNIKNKGQSSPAEHNLPIDQPSEVSQDLPSQRVSVWVHELVLVDVVVVAQPDPPQFCQDFVHIAGLNARSSLFVYVQAQHLSANAG